MRINKTNPLGAPGDTLRCKTGMSGNQAWKVRDALQNRVARNRWEGREKLKQARCQTSIYRKCKGEEKGQQRWKFRQLNTQPWMATPRLRINLTQPRTREMQGTLRSRQNEEKKKGMFWEVRHRWTLGFPLATQLLENPGAGRSALKRKVLAPRILYPARLSTWFPI